MKAEDSPLSTTHRPGTASFKLMSATVARGTPGSDLELATKSGSHEWFELLICGWLMLDDLLSGWVAEKSDGQLLDESWLLHATTIGYY